MVLLMSYHYVQYIYMTYMYIHVYTMYINIYTYMYMYNAICTYMYMYIHNYVNLVIFEREELVNFCFKSTNLKPSRRLMLI